MILASLYPLICAVVAYALFCGFIAVVVPHLNAARELLPHSWPIELLWKLHHYRGYFTLVVPATVVTVAVVSRWLRHDVTRGFWQGLTSFRWVIGRSLNWAQFTELFALRWTTTRPSQRHLFWPPTRQTTFGGNARCEVGKKLTSGATLTESTRSAVSLPPLVRWMLATGEKQGRLPATLRQLSETYRRLALRRAAIVKVWLPVIMTICFTGAIGLAYGLAFFLPLRAFLMGLTEE